MRLKNKTALLKLRPWLELKWKQLFWRWRNRSI